MAKRPSKQSDVKTGHLAKAISVPAMTVTQGDHTFYVFKMKASALWPLASINRRSEDEDKGYQRVLSTARVAAVANHIRSGYPLPNTILIALDKAAKFNPKTHKLSIPAGKNRGWVIDGQHRLAGAHEAADVVDIELCVIAFFNVDIAFQVEQFVTINREAKGVPTSLVYDLLAHLPTLKSSTEIAQERSNEIASMLRKDSDSPFYSRIVIMNSPKAGRQISNTNFVRKIVPLVHPDRGLLRTYTLLEQAQIIDNYYSALRSIFPAEWEKNDNVFFQTVGFGAAMNVFEEVFQLTLSREGGFTKSEIQTTLEGVKHFDLRQWTSHGSGNKAEMEAAQEFRIDLSRALTAKKDAKRIRL